MKYILLALFAFLLYGCDSNDNGYHEDQKISEGKSVSVYFMLDPSNRCRAFIRSYKGGDIHPKSVLVEGCK